MRDPNVVPMQVRVSLEDIRKKVRSTSYTRLSGTVTVCQMEMVNGYVVVGKSACVDPNEYNQALGEKFAYEDAINQLWPLEGYLLAQRRYESQKEAA